MKMFFSVPCAILLFSSAAAFASLGETRDQCRVRYGAIKGDASADQVIFSRNSITIMVTFRGDRSIQEDFAPENHGSISATQLAEILAENSEGSTWEAYGETPVAVTYWRKDSRAQAEYAKEGAMLTNKGTVLILKYTARAAIGSN